MDDLTATITQLPKGVGVIFRHYDRPDRRSLAAEIAPICRRQSRCLLIAGAPEIAYEVGANGVHFPEGQFRQDRAVQKSFPPHWTITTAVHSSAAIQKLRDKPVDAGFLSPLLPTESHKDRHNFLGPTRTSALVRESPVPLYGLGGISGLTATRFMGTGLIGFGAIGALLP